MSEHDRSVEAPAAPSEEGVAGSRLSLSKPGMERLVLRFNRVDHGALLEV